MAKYLFHTNIKCEACEAKIKAKFDEVEGIESFSVDLNQDKRPLTVHTKDDITEAQVKQWITEAGYEAKNARKSGLKSLFGGK